MNPSRYARFQRSKPRWTLAVDEVLGESWMTARMVAEAIQYDVKAATVREYLYYLASIGAVEQSERFHGGSVAKCWRKAECR